MSNTPTDNAEWLESVLNEYARNLHEYSNGVPGHHNDYREQTDQTIATILSHIDTMCREARGKGAKDYNRILTDNLGKCEYYDLDGAIAGIYRQEVVGTAIRLANTKTILGTSGIPTKLNPNKDTEL